VKCEHGYQGIGFLGHRIPEGKGEMFTDALRAKIKSKN
jgi:hypothetical protein